MKKIKIGINKKNIDKLKDTVIMNTDRINQIKEEKSKDKSSKKLVILGAIGVILIIGIILLLQYRHVLGISFSKEGYIKDSAVIELQTTKNNAFLEYCGELLIFTNSTIETYNSSGSKTWSSKIEDVIKPIISTSGNSLIIANENGNIFYVFSNKQEVALKKIDGNIKQVYINNNGYIAIEYSTTGYQSVIGVYDPRGKELFNLYLTTSIISGISISDDNRYLIFGDIETTGITPITNIKLVDMNNSKEILTVVSKQDSVLNDIVVDNNNAIIKTDNEIFTYNIPNNVTKTIKKLTEEQLLFVDISKDAYAYIKKEDTNDKNSIIVKNYDGKEVSTLEYDSTPKMFGYQDGIVWTISDKEILFSTKFGAIVKRFTNQFGISEFVSFNNRKSAAVILINKVYIVNI